MKQRDLEQQSLAQLRYKLHELTRICDESERGVSGCTCPPGAPHVHPPEPLPEPIAAAQQQPPSRSPLAKFPFLPNASIFSAFSAPNSATAPVKCACAKRASLDAAGRSALEDRKRSLQQEVSNADSDVFELSSAPVVITNCPVRSPAPRFPNGGSSHCNSPALGAPSASAGHSDDLQHNSSGTNNQTEEDRHFSFGRDRKSVV